MNREPLERAELAARKIAKKLDRSMPEGWRFALVMFSMSDQKLATYISNCQREGMIKALRECADKIEHREDNL